MKGTKVKQKKTPRVGTLHQRVDWILKADLDKKYKKGDTDRVSLSL